MGDLARLLGDWAFLDGAIRTSQPSGPIVQVADEPPRKLTRYDTWLDPQLLFPEERADRGVRVTSPAAPADPGRGAFGDLLGEQPQQTGPSHFSLFPSFVGVRATPMIQVSGTADGPTRFGTQAPFPTMAVPATGGENLPGVAGPIVGAAITMDEPSNAAPVAANDSATVAEDGSVVIDVMANDSDPDSNELAIDTWQYDPPNGTVTQEAGGVLRYTPFPDFHGTDQFTYTVTDGRLSATATAAVTVTPVNDAPVAFNDAFSELHWGGSGPDTMVWTLSVLANDFDVEGSLYAPAADLDTAGIPTGSGSLSVNAYGEVVWTVPRSFNGAASFRYRATDISGGVSDWATVKLWAIGPNYYPPASYNLVANSDTLTIGDDPVSGNVLTNDTGGEAVATLVGPHPAGSRLTAFGFDGKFTVAPTPSRADASFTYQIVTPYGAYFMGSYATGNVSLWNVNLVS